jgi:hypothetical protein
MTIILKDAFHASLITILTRLQVLALPALQDTFLNQKQKCTQSVSQVRMLYLIKVFAAPVWGTQCLVMHRYLAQSVTQG